MPDPDQIEADFEPADAPPGAPPEPPPPEPPPPEPAWTHHHALVGGLRLHWVEQGTGPLVVLLHGFPEFWYAWRHQLPALAAAGFRAVAPDMRGYGASERPRGVNAYRLELLAGDIAGLIGHLGEREAAAVVGHDWGGAVAFATAVRHPEVVQRLVLLNAPHPATYARELRRGGQLLRSWYALLFQLPWLPERLLRARDFALLRRVLREDPAREGAFTAADVARYVEAWSHPGALGAMLDYYRAAGRRSSATSSAIRRPVRQPTLVIWGERDRYFVPGVLDGLERWIPHLRLKRLPDASHWVQHDRPARVSEALIGFLRR